MQISLSKIFIPTKNRALAFSFLSFVFDAEINADDNSRNYLAIANIQFILSEEYKTKLTQPLFVLKIESKIELENLKNKVELAYYKFELKSKIKTASSNSFEFQDVDKNIWRVESP